jgi:hypothetical protein
MVVADRHVALRLKPHCDVTVVLQRVPERRGQLGGRQEAVTPRPADFLIADPVHECFGYGLITCDAAASEYLLEAVVHWMVGFHRLPICREWVGRLCGVAAEHQRHNLRGRPGPAGVAHRVVDA